MGLFSNLFKKEEVEENLEEYANQKFYMEVEDVFTVVGKGTVVTGRVESGIVHVGDTVSISGRMNALVEGIEMFRKKLDYAKENDACGLLLKDISRDDITNEDYLTK